MARFNLLPRDDEFFTLYEEATSVLIQGADTLVAMLGDLAHAETYRKTIGDLEHAGDAIIHRVMEKVNKTFITPLDQEDIRAIASLLDNVIDYTQAAAERIVLYNATEENPDALALAKVLAQTTRNVQRLMAMLRDLSNQKAVLDCCIEINRLENTGDKTYREGMGRLFRAGDIMELLRWKEILEQIEQAIDECEDLADAVEGLVVKHA